MTELAKNLVRGFLGAAAAFIAWKLAGCLTLPWWHIALIFGLVVICALVATRKGQH